MKGRLNLGIACGVLLAASLCASTAKAQFLSGGGYGLGFFNYGNTGVYFERIPYYALYPPVYYSYPVARTYGYSPFAYPPGTMTPNAPPAAAATYINPYVKRKQPVATEAVDKTVTRGNRGRVRVAQTHINPFVQQASAASTAPLTARLDQ
jgi:hypothetical protein